MTTRDFMIVMNDFRRQWEDTGAAVLSATKRVGASGWYVLGQEVEAFEQALSKHWGLTHSVGVANGMDALEIALRAVGVGPGWRVLTTPISAFATTLAILRCGARPVFVDVDARGLIDLDRVERALEQNAALTALLPVHLYGFALDLERLRGIRSRFALPVIEDCAQAIGARWKDSPVGSVGDAAGTSFYPTKNLGALGDGGAMLTANEEIARHARKLRDYGQREKYVHDILGLNSRLDELQAAILHDALLPKLEGWTQRRKQIAEAYSAALASHPSIRLLRPNAHETSVWHLFPVLAKASTRNALQEHLKRAGVASGVHYPIAIHEQPIWKDGKPESHGSLERSEVFVKEQLSLPIHPYLTDGEIATVIDACLSWKG